MIRDISRSAVLVFLWIASTTLARDLGVDVSHFQNSSGIPQSSWDQMFSEGRTFAYIKATEGLTGPDDATMSANVSRATTAGLLAGVYHYCHAENRPTPTGAVQEADHFLSYAGSAMGPGYLRPALDVEGSALGLSTTGLTDWVIAFSNEIVAQRGPSAAPIIYTTSPFSDFDSRMSSYDLWVRFIGGDPQTGSPSTGQFGNWAVWQYSDSGTAGGISPIDMDVLHNEYRTLAQMTIVPEPASVGMLLAVALFLRRSSRRARL